MGASKSKCKKSHSDYIDEWNLCRAIYSNDKEKIYDYIEYYGVDPNALYDDIPMYFHCALRCIINNTSYRDAMILLAHKIDKKATTVSNPISNPSVVIFGYIDSGDGKTRLIRTEIFDLVHLHFYEVSRVNKNYFLINGVDFVTFVNTIKVFLKSEHTGLILKKRYSAGTIKQWIAYLDELIVVFNDIQPKKIIL